MAPAELMLSGMCMMPLPSKISFAPASANGLLAAPTQNRTPSGKALATPSVMASELAQGTRKSQGAAAQSRTGTHPATSAAPGRGSHVCTRPAPRRASSAATTEPTLPHPWTVKVRSPWSSLPRMASTTPRMLPMTLLAVATLVSTRLFLPARTYLSLVASTR